MEKRSVISILIISILVISLGLIVTVQEFTKSDNERNVVETGHVLLDSQQDTYGSLSSLSSLDNEEDDNDNFESLSLSSSRGGGGGGSSGGSSGGGSKKNSKKADNSDVANNETNSFDNSSDFMDNMNNLSDNPKSSDNKKSKLINDENEDFIDVIVVLKDDEILSVAIDSPVKKKLSEIKSKVKTKQDEVLSTLDSSEFLIKHKYKTVSGFAGKITKEGLDKLEQDPNVEAIYEDELLHITLTESVPLIHADDIHNLGITGEGSVVCVVDTGIDYTHPDLGDCIGYNIDGNIVLDNSSESSHPYNDSFDYTWTITKPGFSQIAVHFDRIGVETGYGDYDYIEILDSNDNVVQFIKSTLSGAYSCEDMYDLWSVSIPGDTIKIRLVSDFAHTCYGFKIDKVLNGTANFYGNIVLDNSSESPHPYEDDYNETWTITMPNFSNIAVHFSNITVEYDYDYIFIKDANDNVVQNFTGNYKNVWSVSVPGDTIKVNLVTDYSVIGWGFAIDKVLNGTASFSLENCEKVIDGYDFVNNDNNPMDDYSHGTHVAGIVAANGNIKGIAPDAELVAVKVLDSGGSGLLSDVAAGIDWCNDKKGEYNIVVTTMSFGTSALHNSTSCPNWTNVFFDRAHALGITLTASSGNDGNSEKISWPACSPNAISVGAVYDADVGAQTWCLEKDIFGRCIMNCTDATTFADKIVCFTNTGPLLDLLAPGSIITSTKLGGGSIGMSGTSMATPHVAGAIALLKQFLPSALPDEIEELLKSTGEPITDPDNGLIFPRINLLAAVRSVVECFSNSDCGTDGYVGEPFCQNDNIYQNYIAYTCDNPGKSTAICSDLTAPILIEDCGEDYCEDWQDNYCEKGDVYYKRICYDKGCSNGICYNNSYEDEQKAQECSNGCTEGRCKIKVCKTVCNIGRCYEYCEWR